MTPSIRVLACGAIDRGDDGAAVRAVRSLPRSARRGAQIEEIGYLSPEVLIGDAPGTYRLVLDCVAGLRSGEIVDLPLADLPDLEARMRTTSTHALAPGAAVALAALLGAVHPGDRFLGIGGERFEMGDDLSPAVSAQLGTLVERMAARIEGARACA
ncbi:MAG: hydrogenase maturation protease [Candidatus Limnocylindria bacterium]